MPSALALATALTLALLVGALNLVAPVSSNPGLAPAPVQWVTLPPPSAPPPLLKTQPRQADETPAKRNPPPPERAAPAPPKPQQAARPGRELQPPVRLDAAAAVQPVQIPTPAAPAEPTVNAGASVAAAAAPAPALVAAAPSRDIGVVCPTQVRPRFPEVLDSDLNGNEAILSARALVRDGRVQSVDVTDGPRRFHRAVREAMLQYRCVTPPGTTVEVTQQFRLRLEEGTR